jgi:hypothetical protein
MKPAGADVLRAVGQSNGQDFTADSFRQLEPVLPQRPVDVQADTAYFVNDVSGGCVRLGSPFSAGPLRHVECGSLCGRFRLTQQLL